MLTADVDSAESCFDSSLDDCMSMKPTVEEWTNGWTRHVLVHNAIAMLRPTPDDDKQPVTCDMGLKPASHAVMRLKNFERFVFVLSILEGYSDRECSLLLGPSSRDIMAAKVRALENLAANLKCLLPEFLRTRRGTIDRGTPLKPAPNFTKESKLEMTKKFCL